MEFSAKKKSNYKTNVGPHQQNIDFLFQNVCFSQEM